MNLDQMWEELARYQPYAEKCFFGEQWWRMRTERTEEAAAAAADAVSWSVKTAVRFGDADGAAMAAVCLGVAMTYFDFARILGVNAIEQENKP